MVGLRRDVCGVPRMQVWKDVESNLSGVSLGKANVFVKFDKADSPGSLRGKSEGVS